MKAGTIEAWEKRGWKLDPCLLNGLGEIINTGNGPYYIGEEAEVGYSGKSIPIMPSRYAMGMKIGRPLVKGEILRYRPDGGGSMDLRLSNIILHSKQATSAELLKANGGPVLGYSHCLCECGTPLDLKKQKEQPYAYVDGHKPVKKPNGNLKKERKPRESVLIESLAKVSQPLLYMPKEQAVPEDSLKEFRALFEKMIHHLPWEEFKELLHLLLEIQTRQEKKTDAGAHKES
jgi:hypothetical protein